MLLSCYMTGRFLRSRVMPHEGGCQCGAVRYGVGGTPQHVALCHCGVPERRWLHGPPLPRMRLKSCKARQRRSTHRERRCAPSAGRAAPACFTATKNICPVLSIFSLRRLMIHPFSHPVHIFRRQNESAGWRIATHSRRLNVSRRCNQRAAGVADPPVVGDTTSFHDLSATK